MATREWPPNLFLVPFGKVGRDFLDELSRLAGLFSNKSDSRCWSLSAFTLAPLLLLQKPSRKSKDADHRKLLESRLTLWRAGDFDSLLREGRVIQKPLNYRPPSKQLCDDKFISLMRQGRVSEATGWLDSARHTSGVKPCDSTVIDELMGKHPPAQPASSRLAFQGPIPDISPVKFDQLCGDNIYFCAKSLRGSGGPSGLDAAGVKRIFCSRKFKASSPALCSAVSKIARTLATKQLDPVCVSVFCSSRLIPLEKQDGGTRPIGIGECFRRLISKAIVRVIKEEIKLAAGTVQLAAGQLGGCEAAIHALKDHFESDSCEAVLLLDASNAFNSMNRKLALHNSAFYCPGLSMFLRNIYSKPSNLFVGSEVILSREGTTQGDPSAMDFYSVGLLYLTELADTDDVLQIWYADDANGAGTVLGVSSWFEKISSLGPSFGYLVNPSKCVLIVKPEHTQKAYELFGHTGVLITTEGTRHLGAVIGSRSFAESFVSSAVDSWNESLNNLVSIAKTNPHLAFSNFTTSFKFKWGYMQRTVPDIGPWFQKLEDTIRDELIPCFVGRYVSDLERRILALPFGMGGLGIDNPVATAQFAHANSRALTEPLVNLISLSEPSSPGSVTLADRQARELRISLDKSEQLRHQAELEEILCQITAPVLARSLKLNAEPGASIWLSSKPFAHLGFELNRLEFLDAIRLRYNFEIDDIHGTCECGKKNSFDHALSCCKGGYTIMRHNGIRDSVAEIMQYAGLKAVQTEKLLLPCTNHTFHPNVNTADDARMDVVCLGLWRAQQLAFMDVRVFHPNAPSYVSKSLPHLYNYHEAAKKRSYGRRIIEVEHGTFSPMVMSTSGGCGPEMVRVLQSVSSLISKRTGEVYAEVMAHLRLRLRFSLLRSVLISLRGTRRTVPTSSLAKIDFNLC